MNKGKKNIGEMVSLYQKELNSRYPETEIKAILFHLFDSLMGWSRATVHLNKGELLNGEVEHRLLSILDRLKDGEPIQYITGTAQFCGLTLKVQPGVLIPRPETEELAVLITRENQRLRTKQISILDIGSGSGCLALAMKKAFTSATVTGIDKFPDTLLVARQNALDNRLEVTFQEGDILTPGSFQPLGCYHLIISNPPYIPEHERVTMSSRVVDHEPGHALFVPDDHPLLYYDSIATFAREYLTPDGVLYVEIHENHGGPTVALFREHSYRKVELLQDFFGKNRFIKASVPG